jgi:hypothetical protein
MGFILPAALPNNTYFSIIDTITESISFEDMTQLMTLLQILLLFLTFRILIGIASIYSPN